MQPIRTTELALNFASSLSPWWLTVLLPLAVLAGLWLYRGPWKDIPRWQAAGILILRSILLAGLVFLAFRPSLQLRTILTYPGRIVLLLDDSESMTAADTGLSDTEALRLSRNLQHETGTALPPCHELARLLAASIEGIRRFQAFAQAADRTADRFWAEAERASKSLSDRFDEFEKEAGTMTGLSADERLKFDDVLARIPGFRTGAQMFFTGDRNPPARVYEAYAESLESARQALYAIQAALDEKALADSASPLHERVATVRRQSRLELMGRALNRLRADAVPGAAVASPVRTDLVCMRMMTGESWLLANRVTDPLTAKPGRTDILGAIDRLVAEENPFPLAGIVLFSEGRQLGGGSARATARLASRKQAPIQVAAMGAVAEPDDLSIVDVSAPPFAVKGSPVTIRVRLKTILPAPADIRVDLLCGGAQVAGETIRAGESKETLCVFQLTPPATGRFRYTVRIAPLDSERLPARNNGRDFVMHVRDDKVRVLLLDGKPRWETRFVLNILQRLDYIDLNAIIVAAQPDSTLVRGIRKGTWPRDPDTLALYDLILLGDLPADLLGSPEWTAIRDWVEKGGKTVVFMGNGAGASHPPSTDVSAALWPVAGLATVPHGDRENALDTLCVTETGRLHPVTASMGSALPVASEEGVPRLRPDTQVLALTAPGGEPVIACRRAGRGKSLLIDEDHLWKRLNPSLLEAHGSLVLSLVSWAVEGDAALDEAGRPVAVPVLDQHVADIREPLQVWLTAGDTNAVVDAEVEGRVVESQPVRRTRPGAGLARAVFSGLPATDVVFRVRGGRGTTAPVHGIESLAELGFVGRHDALLSSLAADSGGRVTDFTDAGLLLSQIQPVERVEKREQVWRLWDAAQVFGFLIFMLTAEWVWRKWVGLL